MAITSNHVNSTTVSPGYGAVPAITKSVPLTTGQIYTTNNTGTFLTSEVMRINQTNPPTLEVKGNLMLNGVDLEERLKTIEQVLTIPERDVKL